MKKIISLISILALCAVGLSACIQVVAPTPQQQNYPAGVQQTAPIQQQAPVAQQQQSAPVQQQVPAQQSAPIQQAPIQGGYSLPQFSITLEQAKNTALNAVGMNAGSVTFIKQRQDYDDAMPEYEIEFIANNMKYEFEISGVNGAILKQEIESVFD